MGSCTVALGDIAPGTGPKKMWCPLVFDARWQKKQENGTGQVEVEVEVFEETGRPRKWKDGGKSLSISTPSDHTVTIRVLRAEGLLAKDKGGTSDPFVELRIEKQKFKTVIPKTLDPGWNETFSCDCDVAGAHLDVIVHDGTARSLLDVVIVSPYAGNDSFRAACACRDGHASRRAAVAKRARYPNRDLVPFALETGGRMGNDARAFLSRMADAAEDRHSELQYLQRAISSVLQDGIAMMLQPKLGGASPRA